MIRKSIAFTLAETLIVIGIIGVVSALTLPNLNSSTGEKEKVAKVKKLHQNLEDAVGRSIAIYGPINEWKALDNDASAQLARFGNRLTEFMKLSKSCGLLATPTCMAYNTIKIGSSNLVLQSSVPYQGILADGTSFFISLPRYGTADYVVTFDIDGSKKGANVAGKDIFSFLISSDGVIAPQQGEDFSGLTTGMGERVTNWVINFDNLDYLKANQNGKCNDSNVTLNALANPPVTSCK